jgi:hypothetical protein
VAQPQVEHQPQEVLPLVAVPHPQLAPRQE